MRLKPRALGVIERLREGRGVQPDRGGQLDQHLAIGDAAAFDIRFAERLAGQILDAAVLRHHVVAQLRRDRLAAVARHHAAAVRLHGQEVAGSLDRRRGAVAPAAQRIVEIVQCDAIHVFLPGMVGRPGYHVISPLLTLAPMSSAIPRPACG